MRGPGMGTAAAVAVLAFCISGCAVEGDFGRRQPSVITDTFLPVSGRHAAAQRGEPASSFMMTDDEKELRDRAWRFLSPAIARSSFDIMLAQLRVTRVRPPDGTVPSPTSYYQALMSLDFRSSRPPYHRLIDDMTADDKLLEGYFAVLARVDEADRIREKGLPYIADLAPSEREAALARIAENRGLAGWVSETMTLRIAAYRYALQRLFIEIPDRDAVSAERILALLEARATGVRTPAPARSGMARLGKGYYPFPTDATVPQK